MGGIAARDSSGDKLLARCLPELIPAEDTTLLAEHRLGGNSSHFVVEIGFTEFGNPDALRPDMVQGLLECGFILHTTNHEVRVFEIGGPVKAGCGCNSMRCLDELLLDAQIASADGIAVRDVVVEVLQHDWLLRLRVK